MDEGGLKLALVIFGSLFSAIPVFFYLLSLKLTRDYDLLGGGVALLIAAAVFVLPPIMVAILDALAKDHEFDYGKSMFYKTVSGVICGAVVVGGTIGLIMAVMYKLEIFSWQSGQ